MNSWVAIFDWDGVVIDSSRQHEEAWEAIARGLEKPLPPNFFKRTFGMKNNRVIPEILGWSREPAEIDRLSLQKEKIYRDLILTEGTVLIPGTIPWLEQLTAANIPRIIASSAPRANIECVLPLFGLEKFFPNIVASEDVTHGKPNPEVFLAAAQRLNTPPGRCLVFEDAHVGIEAARAARMRVIALDTTHPADSLSDADRVVHRLDELTVEEITRWFQQVA